LHCEACQPGSPKLAKDELEGFLSQNPGWQVIPYEGIEHLERTFPFKNFVSALAFTNKIGVLAEQEGHHPALLTEWGKVKVSWWTHAIAGLHRNDLIMAAKTDLIFTEKS
jgi:4a-hydroxytetrahydrobiopterin dehydratase